MPHGSSSNTTAVEISKETFHVAERGSKITPSTSSSGPADDVLQASAIADAEVPDGGYGWVVITGCAIVTWWFIGAQPG